MTSKQVLTHSLRIKLFGRTAYRFGLPTATETVLLTRHILRPFGEDRAIRFHLCRLRADLPWTSPPCRNWSQAAIGNWRNVVVLHIGDEFRLLRSSVKLNLVGVRNRQVSRFDFLQMLLIKIAYANASRLSHMLQLQKGLPLRDATAIGVRRVNQVQIHILDTWSLQAGIAFCNRAAARGELDRPEFRSQEDVFPRRPLGLDACADTYTNGLLVPVYSGGV